MNTNSVSRWTPIGAVIAGLAVMSGAMGAHGIDSYLVKSYAGETRQVTGVTIPAAQKYLADFKTASRYQLAHGLGLIVVGLLSGSGRRRAISIAGWSFVLGTGLFCGSLYGLALTAHGLAPGVRHVIGLTAATGGTLLIVGWFALAAAACPCGRSADECHQ